MLWRRWCDCILETYQRGWGRNELEKAQAHRRGIRIYTYNWKVGLPQKVQTIYEKHVPALRHEGMERLSVPAVREGMVLGRYRAWNTTRRILCKQRAHQRERKQPWEGEYVYSATYNTLWNGGGDEASSCGTSLRFWNSPTPLVGEGYLCRSWSPSREINVWKDSCYAK